MKLKPQVYVQYFIDANYVFETLRKISAEIGIKRLICRNVGLAARKRMILTNSLKRHGVTYAYEAPAIKEYGFNFMDMTKGEIERNIRLIAKEGRFNPDRVIVRQITLNLGDCTAIFSRTRKKFNSKDKGSYWMLGLDSSEGNIAELLRVLNAKKTQCTFITETIHKRKMICNE